MWRKESLEQLQTRLLDVDAQIAAHPLSSERVQRANEIVALKGVVGIEEVERLLAEQALPSLEELGQIQVAGTVSWWRLHRERRKIETKIERSAKK